MYGNSKVFTDLFAETQNDAGITANSIAIYSPWILGSWWRHQGGGRAIDREVRAGEASAHGDGHRGRGGRTDRTGGAERGSVVPVVDGDVIADAALVGPAPEEHVEVAAGEGAIPQSAGPVAEGRRVRSACGRGSNDGLPPGSPADAGELAVEARKEDVVGDAAASARGRSDGHTILHKADVDQGRGPRVAPPGAGIEPAGVLGLPGALKGVHLGWVCVGRVDVLGAGGPGHRPQGQDNRQLKTGSNITHTLCLSVISNCTAPGAIAGANFSVAEPLILQWRPRN